MASQLEITLLSRALPSAEASSLALAVHVALKSAPILSDILSNLLLILEILWLNLVKGGVITYFREHELVRSDGGLTRPQP